MGLGAAPFRSDEASGGFAFISYARGDLPWAFACLTPLHEQGFRFWYDESCEAGEDWRWRIADAIEKCTVFVLLVSGVSVERPEIRNEVAMASRLQKPILVVELVHTELPRDLALQVSRFQSVRLPTGDLKPAVDEIRSVLERRGLFSAKRGPEGSTMLPPDLVVEWPQYGSPTSKPLPRRAGTNSRRFVDDLFVDRVSESEAVLASVQHQLRRLRDEEDIQPGVHDNVLTFHGGVGVGKSGLSQRLRNWMRGAVPDGDHWGPWPLGKVRTVEWDFHGSGGEVDFVRQMIEVRNCLVGGTRPYLAFDLALAVYLSNLGIDDRVGLGLSGDAMNGVLYSLRTIAAQQLATPPQTLDLPAVQEVVGRVLRTGKPGWVLDENAFALGPFLRACEQGPGCSRAADLAADLVYVLTQEMHYTPASERPVLVFFLDHFERLQVSGRVSHEAAIARIVMNLPYALFVVTGRNRLDWWDSRRTDLEEAGPDRWPGLAEGSTKDPRQHNLGRLSGKDTRRLYEEFARANHWVFPTELVDKLVRRSDGLPLHIDAVVKLASNIRAGRPDLALTAEELDQELPEVVRRIMQTLTGEERNAFRAACVLPFFSVELVARVAGVNVGTASQAIRRALVEPNSDDTYPNKVHDEIRRLVRIDRSTDGFWGDHDWRDAATRALDVTLEMIAKLHLTDEDAAEISAIALAVKLCLEWDLPVTVIIRPITEAPSIALLSSLVPHPDRPLAQNTEAEAVARFIHAYSLPYLRCVEPLRELSATNFRIAVTAKRFLAYRFRMRGRHQDALEIFRALVDEDPDRSEYNGRQFAMTLRSMRRYRDALEFAEAHYKQTRRDRFETVILRQHGEVGLQFSAASEVDHTPTASKRVRLETVVGNMVRRAQVGTMQLSEIEDVLKQARAMRAGSQVRSCLRALGYLYLADEERLAAITEEIKTGMEQDESTASTLTHLFALKALMTGLESDALAALRAVPSLRFRGPAWISGEVWLEELGHPLEPVPTQWLIPYERVRENWLGIANGIIERARRGEGLG